MDCEALLACLDNYLDGETDAETNRRIRTHVATCILCQTLCRVESQSLDRLRGALSAPPMPEGLAARIHAAIESERDSR